MLGDEAYNADDLLLRDRQLRQLRKPSRQLHLDLFNYMFNNHSINEDDERFMYFRDDFVCLADTNDSTLDRLIHHYMDHKHRSY